MVNPWIHQIQPEILGDKVWADYNDTMVFRRPLLRLLSAKTGRIDMYQ